MNFTRAIQDVSSFAPPTAFEFAREYVPMAWIEAALISTGSASIRRRKLPAEHVVWLVIGMALFRDRSIAAVVSHLGLAHDGESRMPGSVVPAAIAQARGRLGDAALQILFNRTADAWTADAVDAHRWRGLRVYAVDGTTVNVPDTPQNHEYFGRPGTSRGGASGYPKAKIVALTAARSHLLAGLAIGPYRTSEPELAEQLWARIPDESITILDRGFLAYPTLRKLHDASRHRHWLTRAKKNTPWKTIKPLGEDDLLIRMKFSPSSRAKDPSLPRDFIARAIRYQRPGFDPQWLLTSLLDPATHPASEIIALYHERWEIELAFDEKKTHMLEREEALRSKTPIGVLQEIWGLGIAFNLVRLMMSSVAAEARLHPSRISFRNTLLLVRNFLVMAWNDKPGTLPKLLASMRKQIHLLILPPRRPRSSPRHVKVKMSAYKKKPPLPHARTTGAALTGAPLK